MQNKEINEIGKIKSITPKSGNPLFNSKLFASIANPNITPKDDKIKRSMYLRLENICFGKFKFVDSVYDKKQVEITIR